MFEQPWVCANMLAVRSADFHTVEHTWPIWPILNKLHRAVSNIFASYFSLNSIASQTVNNIIEAIAKSPANHSPAPCSPAARVTFCFRSFLCCSSLFYLQEHIFVQHTSMSRPILVTLGRFWPPLVKNMPVLPKAARKKEMKKYRNLRRWDVVVFINGKAGMLGSIIIHSVRQINDTFTSHQSND